MKTLLSISAIAAIILGTMHQIDPAAYSRMIAALSAAAHNPVVFPAALVVVAVLIWKA